MPICSFSNPSRIVGICALLLTGAATQASDDATVRAALVANYARFTVAFQKKDASAMAKMMTDDYTAIGPDGSKATKDHVLADMKGQMGMLHQVQWVRKITALKVTGKTAEATVNGDLTGTNMGKDGKAHKLQLLATTDDTWVMVGKGTWKIAKSRVVKVKMLFDGSEAPPH